MTSSGRADQWSYDTTLYDITELKLCECLGSLTGTLAMTQHIPFVFLSLCPQGNIAPASESYDSDVSVVLM